MKKNRLTELSIESFQAGDERTFNVVYDTFLDPIYLFVFKILKNHADSEAITANVLFQLWQNRSRMTGIPHMKNFLYYTALRACIDRLRRRRADASRYESVPEPDMLSMELQAGEYTPRLEFMEGEIMKEALLAAIREESENLPRQCREVFRLHYLENKPVHEILKTLRIKKSTFYNQRRNAIIRIRVALRKKGYDRVPIILLFILSLFLK